MIVKVSYNEQWSKKGTHYDQTLNCSMTKSELRGYVNSVLDILVDANMKSVKTSEEMNNLTFLKHCNKGINFTNITTFRYFVNYFKLGNNKRIKNDRNTIIKINVV